MGEIADDIIDGSCCDICGMYFQDPDKKDMIYTHDYPVTCWDCWKDLSKSEKKLHQRAEVST
jgi:hypothetical protein